MKNILVLIIILAVCSSAYAIRIGENFGSTDFFGPSDRLNVSGPFSSATSETNNFVFVDGNNFIFVDGNNFVFID